MAIIRFDPFKGFETVASKVNDIFDNFEKGVSVEYGSFSPRIDISEDDNTLIFQAELPGMSKEEVKITINDENILYIKGEKKIPYRAEEDSKCFVRCERNYGAFSRSFMLPELIDQDSIKAKFSDGILEITLNKKEPEKPKEVNVEIH